MTDIGPQIAFGVIASTDGTVVIQADPTYVTPAKLAETLRELADGIEGKNGVALIDVSSIQPFTQN